MSNDEIYNKLIELFDLYKSGAIMQEEYLKLKSKIIFHGEEPQQKENDLGNAQIKANIEDNVAPQQKELKSNLTYESKEKTKENIITKTSKDILKSQADSNPNNIHFKTKTKLGIMLLMSALILGILVVTILLIINYTINNKLSIDKSNLEQKIAQLSTIILLKSDSISLLNKKVENSFSTLDSIYHKIIPIPETIQKKILLINKNNPNRISSDVKLYENSYRIKYVLEVQNNCEANAYDSYSFIDIDSDIWQFETAECGNGGNVMQGSILFTDTGLMEINKINSCGGVLDCNEYLTVLVNNTQIYHNETKTSSE